MRKQIGIVTWIGFPNFGTYLQALALKKVLEGMGYAPKFVDDTELCMKYTLEFYNRSNPIRRIISRVYRFTRSFTSRGKNETAYRDIWKQTQTLFRDFRDRNLPLSQDMSGFDTVIAGSDQIWAPHFPLQEWNMRHYFLADYNGRKVAYAPSLGMPAENEEEYLRMVTPWLLGFDALSAREPQGARIVSKAVGHDVDVLPDPTLLLTKKEWEETFGLTERESATPYSLCYLLTYNKDIIDSFEAYSRRHNLSPVVILNNAELMNHDGIDKRPAGPEDFLNLLYGAEAFVTDSFHGVIFSMLFEIPSAVYRRFPKDETNRQNSRIENLFSLIASRKRLIIPGEPISDDDMFIDETSPVISALDAERKKAIEYLTKNLERHDR